MIEIIVVLILLFVLGYLNYRSMIIRSKSITEKIINSRKEKEKEV